MIRVGHFFAGAGGGILASEILGHESVLAVEIDPFRCSVLQHWFPRMHVECCDIREFDPQPWAGRLDCIAAGFPCQDISLAGKGRGIHGERSGTVWRLFQVIDVVRPPIVFLENVPAIRTRGRREVIEALVERGYSWRDGVLAASDVGAGHERKRWWCLAANADGIRKLEQERRVAYERGWIGNGIAETADALRVRLAIGTKRGMLSETEAEAIAAAARYTAAYCWLPAYAGICRVVDGLARRVDRIRALGDGQIPLQAAVAWGILAWT